MINVSEMALIALFETLEQIKPDSGEGFRLIRESGSMMLNLDTPGPQDTTIRYQNRVILIIDPATLNDLGRGTILTADSPDDPYLVLKHFVKPNYEDIYHLDVNPEKTDP